MKICWTENFLFKKTKKCFWYLLCICLKNNAKRKKTLGNYFGKCSQGPEWTISKKMFFWRCESLPKNIKPHRRQKNNKSANEMENRDKMCKNLKLIRNNGQNMQNSRGTFCIIQRAVRERKPWPPHVKCTLTN